MAALGWFEAVLYGVIQGATEFLPVSSSGHLAIAHRMGLADIPTELELPFDVLLHAASLVAIVIAFRREIVDAVRRGPRFWVLILLGILPAGLAGLLLGDVIDAFGDHLLLIGCAYVLTAGLLTTAQIAAAKRVESGIEDPGALTWRQALAVGLVQILALLPGVSRSGTTVATGLLSGLGPKLAVAFSFLLGFPLIAAAAAKDALDGGFGALIGAVGAGPVALAAAVCFLVSWACILALKLVVAKGKLVWFAGYCLCIAIACWVMAVAG